MSLRQNISSLLRPVVGTLARTHEVYVDNPSLFYAKLAYKNLALCTPKNILKDLSCSFRDDGRDIVTNTRSSTVEIFYELIINIGHYFLPGHYYYIGCAGC